MKPNPHASALGKLNKGKKKTMSEAAIEQRRNAAKKPEGEPVSRTTEWRRKKKLKGGADE